MTYPYSTGPDIQTKDTAKDVSVNTAQFFNAADWNDMRTLLRSMRGQMVGGDRFYCERRAAGTLTAVTVRTGTIMANWRRKTIASARVLIPGVTGTVWVWGRANVGTAAGRVVTGASEPSPYASATLDFPIAKVVITGGTMSITHVRPDWVLANRQV